MNADMQINADAWEAHMCELCMEASSGSTGSSTATGSDRMRF